MNIPCRCHTSPIKGSFAIRGENAKFNTNYNMIRVKLSEFLFVAVEVHFLKRALDKTFNILFAAF